VGFTPPRCSWKAGTRGGRNTPLYVVSLPSVRRLPAHPPGCISCPPALLPSLPLFVDVVLAVTIPASLSLADKLVVAPTSLNEGRGEGDVAAYPHCHRRCPHCGVRGRPRGVEIAFSRRTRWGGGDTGEVGDVDEAGVLVGDVACGVDEAGVLGGDVVCWRRRRGGNGQ
jgi:hypothetical protein